MTSFMTNRGSFLLLEFQLLALLPSSSWLCPHMGPTTRRSPAHFSHSSLSACWAEPYPSFQPQVKPSPQGWFSTSALSCLLQDGLILAYGCNHHSGLRVLSSSHLSPRCLQDSNPHCQTVISHCLQTKNTVIVPPPGPRMQPFSQLVVLFCSLFVFCHSAGSQAGLDSKNA